jgi:hypothetical protein
VQPGRLRKRVPRKRLHLIRTGPFILRRLYFSQDMSQGPALSIRNATTMFCSTGSAVLRCMRKTHSTPRDLFLPERIGHRLQWPGDIWKTLSVRNDSSPSVEFSSRDLSPFAARGVQDLQLNWLSMTRCGRDAYVEWDTVCLSLCKIWLSRLRVAMGSDHTAKPRYNDPWYSDTLIS